MKEINWNLYRAFIAVYETKSLNAAAQLLEVSKAAVGQNIKALSDQAGAQLFNTHAKGVEPTSEAVAIYPEIKQAIQLLIQSEKNLQEFTKDTKAVVRLSIPSTLASFYLKDYFKRFSSDYPKVKFDFVGGNSFALLEQKKIDFIINLDCSFKDYDFKTIDLFMLHGCFIASRDYLTQNELGEKITKEKLLEQQLIAHHEPWADLAKLNGLQEEPFITAASTEFAYSMVKSDMGIGYYYDELLDRQNDPGIVKVTAANIVLPQIKIVFGYNSKHLTKPAQAFVKGLQSFIKKELQG